MSGHSFGALTTQAMAGQAVGRETPEYFTEPRFTAGILYSPVPNFRVALPPEEIYGPISMPLLHMTGTNDVSPVEGFGYDKRVEVWEHAKGPDQHLMIINGADHMVFNGSRGQLPDYPDLETDKDVISITSLAWWDAFLKDDDAAMEWLKGEACKTGLVARPNTCIKTDRHSITVLPLRSRAWPPITASTSNPSRNMRST